jgi:hypothetical protein
MDAVAKLRPPLPLPTLQATAAAATCTTDSAILSHALALAPRFAHSARMRSTERVRHCRRAEQPPPLLFLASGPPLLNTVMLSSSPRRAAPHAPLRRLPRSPERATAAVAVLPSACERGQHAVGHHGASHGHRWVRTNPVMLPRHSSFAVVPPPAATGRFTGELLCSNCVRDIAGEFD